MPKPLQVFISSTSIDLQEHRKAVFDALTQAGEYAIDMKYFGSRPDDPQTVCMDAIKAADVLVGIYACRYGFVPKDETRSITEMEFDHAQALGKQCLCYVVDEDYSWPIKYIENSALEKLNAFKEKIGAKVTRTTFTTPDNLAKSVVADLAQRMKEHLAAEQPPRAENPTKKEPLLISPAYALFVNRTKQDEQFQTIFWSNPPSKPLYFYLYGDARQAHDALSQRFGYECAGMQLDWKQAPDIPAEDNKEKKRWKYQRIKPDFSENEPLNRIKLLNELYREFDLDLESPASDRTLADLLKSPLLKGFTPRDTVILLLTLDRHNWKPLHVPAVVRTFISQFCAAPLPQNAPRFIFFFGIEYDENHDALRQDIKKAIDERQYGEALDELAPVTPADLEAWFSKTYSLPLRKDDENDKDITLRHFGYAETHHMKTVILTLKRLIEQYNNEQL